MASPENITCPICHLGRLSVHFQASPLDYSLNQQFPISICSKCGYGMTGDIPSQTGSLYVGGCYDLKEKAWHKLIRPLLTLLERGKLNYFTADKPSGKKLLEIGCGKGKFLEVAKKCGFQVFGIEPSPRSFAFASARLGNSVASITLEELEQVSEFPDKYDYVLLWHVLEHLSDPSAVLSRIKEKLTCNGKVVIAVPNFASFQAKFGKADWYHLDPPRHIHHFAPESLRILANENGFAVEKIFFNSFYQNYVGELTTIVNKFLPGKTLLFNGLRLNRDYFYRFGLWAGWSMFVFGLFISLLLSLPILVLTFMNQIVGTSGTMVVILKTKN